MIESAPGIERLRRAFSTYDDPEIEVEEIDAERIYRAAAGELREDERRAVIDQVATSAAAAEIWRLAIELQRAEARAAEAGDEPFQAFAADPSQPAEESHALHGVDSPPPPPAIRDERGDAEILPFRRPASQPAAAPSRRRLYTALAAVLAATIGFGLWTRSNVPAPTFRGAETTLAATIEEGARLPSGGFRLVWSPLPDPGARYTVRVTTEDLRQIAEGRHLEGSSYQVPESALAGLPDGTRLLWQVEAKTSDGRTIGSPTYTVEITRSGDRPSGR